MNEPTPNCPACESPTNPLAPHKLDCPRITLANALFHAKYLKLGEAYYHRVYQQQLASAQRWEGKFRVVKHENNQLRKKLGARYPATPAAPAAVQVAYSDGATAAMHRWMQSCAEVEKESNPNLHQTTP